MKAIYLIISLLSFTSISQLDSISDFYKQNRVSFNSEKFQKGTSTAKKANQSFNDDSIENVNFVTYDLSSKMTNYEIFDENNYSNRNQVSTVNEISDYKENNAISPATVFSPDERTQITNAKTNPYLPTAKLIAYYEKVYNNATKKYQTIRSYGTAFLEGPNLAVTAGHCCYQDVTDSGNYDDGIDNPRFPDRIEFYFGCDSSSDLDQKSSYRYYAEANVIHLEYSFYEKPNNDHDWSAIVLDRSIGNTIGWYGKISNWHEKNHSLYSWGYPGDKPKGTLWKTQGRTTNEKNKYRYFYDMDTNHGQSGSPIFVTVSSGTYVCGIHTAGNDEKNSGTKITGTIFAYLNSFVTSYQDHDTFENLVLNVKSRNGSSWVIGITNTTSHVRKVSYNKKMCYFNDAKEWKNLSDLETITVSPYKTAYVNISTNWFATSIAVSYVYLNKRVITYADNLEYKDEKGALKEYNNIISC